MDQVLMPIERWKSCKHTLCANLCCCRLRPVGSGGRNLERGARAEEAEERTEALEDDVRARCMLNIIKEKVRRGGFRAKEPGAPKGWRGQRKQRKEEVCCAVLGKKEVRIFEQKFLVKKIP